MIFKINSHGHLIWMNEKNQTSREYAPAVIWPSGVIKYYLNGLRHREDGPAIIWSDGSNTYFFNGLFYYKKDYWDLVRLRQKVNDFKD